MSNIDIKNPLTNLTIKELSKFCKDNNLGDLTEVKFAPNKPYAKANISEFALDDYSLTLTVTRNSGITQSYIFSKHGLANIHDGTRKLYTVDSEERFSAENPEYNLLTIQFIKLLASKSNVSYLNEELEYRQKSIEEIAPRLEKFKALKSHYTNMTRRYLEKEGENSHRYLFNKKELDRYIDLCEAFKNLKAFQNKCVRVINKEISNIDEMN